MRIFVALAVYVSLAAGAFAEAAKTDWGAVHLAGMVATEQGNFEQALDRFQQSWLLAQTEEQRGVSANDIGQSYRHLRRPGDAREWLERAHELWKKRPGEGRYLCVTASSLADLYRDTGDYNRAEALLREALAGTKDLQWEQEIQNSLADLLREEGRSSEARELFCDLLHGGGIPETRRVEALIGLADIDRQARAWEASISEWNQALELARSRKNEYVESIALRGLASVWLSQGNLARAEPLFRRSLALAEKNPAAVPQDFATIWAGIGELYRDQNKLALAQDAWTKALEFNRSAFGDVHPQVARVLEMLAEIQARRGERELALDYSNRAVDTMQSLFGENAPATAVAFANRATVEQNVGRLQDAEADFKRAVTILRANPGNDALQRNLIQNYAGLLKSMHRNREAAELNTSFGQAFRN